MTIVVSLASGKGGVTKSTLSRALGVTYAKAEWETLLADLDIGQATSANWMRRRHAAEVSPTFDVLSMGTTTQLKRHIDSGKYDVVIVDNAAFASKTTVDVAHISDLMVIPTSFSLDDLESTINTANSLVKAGIPIKKLAITFSGVSENEADYAAALDYVGQTPYFIIDGYIPRKPALSKAQDSGRSIVECSYVVPRKKADDVIQGILDRIEAVTGE